MEQEKQKNEITVLELIALINSMDDNFIINIELKEKGQKDGKD